MKCKYTNIMLYWSEELSQRQREEMKRHLKSCNTCQEVLANLEALEKEFTTLPIIKPERDLVQAAIEKQTTPERRPWWLPAPAIQFAAAITVVLALILWYCLINMPDQVQTPHEETEVPIVSYSNMNLEHQISSLHERVNNLEERVRDGRHKRVSFTRTAKINKRVSVVWSDLDKLKASIVNPEVFPFHNTFTRQKRRTYENKTFHQHHYNTLSTLLLFDVNPC
jgi:hypothetical protein